MKSKMFRYMLHCITIAVLFAGCSKELIKAPLAASRDRWDMTLAGLTLGPDQYNTAGGYWEPPAGEAFRMGNNQAPQ